MMERIDNGVTDSFEPDHQASSSNTTTRLVLFAVLAGAVLVGWHFFGPRSALGKAGWIDDWDRAVERSAETGKPALALFTADWCPSCEQFESQVLTDPDVQQYLRDNYTLVLVDLSKRGGPNDQRAREMGIRAVPTMILYDRSGQELARAHGMPEEMLLLWLKSSAGTAAR